MTMPTLRPSVSFALLLLTWWGANNIYAVDAELLFRRFNSPFLFVDLTTIQTLLGIFLCYLYTRTRPPKPLDHVSVLPTLSITALAIGSLHFLGSLLTNVSYSLIGSTSTLMWKLTEPLSAVCLKRLVLAESTTPTAIIGVIITLSGVLLFSKSSFTLPSFSPIILSNIIFPARNVFIKLTQREGDISSDRRFLHMLITALPLSVAAFLIKLIFYGGNPPAMAYMLRNAVLFNAYHVASFLLLERLDPLTHSLLNTLKRFTGILLSMAIIKTPMQGFHYQAIGITIIGFCVYLAGGTKKYKFGSHGFAFGIVVGMITMIILRSSFGDLMRGSEVRLVKLDNAAREKELKVKSATIERSEFPSGEGETPGKYVVVIKDTYSQRRRDITYTSYEEAVLDKGGNVGNLVWQYGAYEKLPDFSGVTLCLNDSIRNCPKIAEEEGKKLVRYLPMANSIQRSQDFFGEYVDAMKKNVFSEVVVVGVGIQEYFRKDYKRSRFNSSAKITSTSDEFPIPMTTKQFIDINGERGGKMLVRGDFTNQVIQSAGFKESYSVGCPSFWINEDVHLGRSLEKRYRAVAERVGDKSLKIAVNLKDIPGFEKQIEHFRDNYPNSRFYAQGAGDMSRLGRLRVPFERVRLFTNVEGWIADLREMDVAYGVRIHGNMISLAAGLPVIVVAPDWRVLELVEVMKIPHFTTFDEVFDEDVDVAKLVKLRVDEFDGEEFDRNRCEIAKVYMKVFKRYGIEVRRHVKQVSQLC